MSKKEKVIVALSVICMVLTIVIGYTYAYWTLSKQQTGVNKLTTGCLNVEFTGTNDIEIKQAYPVSDQEGMSYTPYTFTIENKCNSFATYQINIETYDVAAGKNRMPDNYVKTNLKKEYLNMYTGLLDDNIRVSPSLSGATTAYKLTEGMLKDGEIQTYDLRIWMDSSVTITNTDSMNAVFNGKISVVFTAAKDPFKNAGTIQTVPYDEVEDEIYSDKLWAYREDISEIEFQNTLEPIVGAAYSFDISSTNDGSVMAYLVNDGSTYKAYIQGNGGVKANPDSSVLFYGFTSLESISGLQYFDTRSVTNMTGMFAFCTSLTTINLNNFDTREVTTMANMFMGCESLQSIDLSGFDTSKVTSLEGMFSNCYDLTSPQLGSFKTNNVTTIEGMFDGCEKLTSIDLSNFNTSSVTTMENLFRNCKALQTLDLSNFNTSEVTNMSYMFQNCNNLTTLNISGFDTTKVTDMQKMFQNCPKVNTTLTIRNTTCNYNVMFSSAATTEGSQIILNYTTASEALVDNMLGTKAYEAHVSKAENPIA